MYIMNINCVMRIINHSVCSGDNTVLSDGGVMKLSYWSPSILFLLHHSNLTMITIFDVIIVIITLIRLLLDSAFFCEKKTVFDGKLRHLGSYVEIMGSRLLTLLYVLSSAVEVQTNLVPPKQVQSGMLQSSLVQASVATMQNPMGCSVPRHSVSRPASMVTSMDAGADGSALLSVMKWKTVLAVFVVVVIYLVAGSLVFRALEQPFENNQKDTITAEKAAFLKNHPCVTPDELELLIKVTFLIMFHDHHDDRDDDQFSLKVC